MQRRQMVVANDNADELAMNGIEADSNIFAEWVAKDAQVVRQHRCAAMRYVVFSCWNKCCGHGGDH